MMKQIEIAVTGMGAVSPFGMGVSTFWDNLIANRSAVREITDDNVSKWTKVGARVPEFAAVDFLPKKIIRNTDYFTQLALIAADEALKDAGLFKSDGETFRDGIDRNRFGTAIGTAFGGIQSLEQASEKLTTGRAKE